MYTSVVLHLFTVEVISAGTILRYTGVKSEPNLNCVQHQGVQEIMSVFLK